MQYRANENDLLPTVRDFETMCDYIHTGRPLLTQKGDLSTKACFELNDLMTHPKRGAKKTDRMGQYATLCLYYQIASAASFLEPCAAKGGKTAVALSKAYDGFKQMNSFSKYLFLFLSWMHGSDIEELYARDTYIASFGASIMDAVITEIGKQSEFEWILREEKHDFFTRFEYPLQLLMNGHFDFLCHLRDFGLLIFDDNDVDASDAYHISVGKILITRFGATLSAACDSRKISWVNRLENGNLSLEDDEDSNLAVREINKEDFRKNPPGSDGFLAPFLPCFPANAVDTAALNSLLFSCPGEISNSTVYEFKVRLGRACCRVIQCTGLHTFEDLHLAIQNAFAFDNDHLYCFFMDGKKWSRRRIDSPYSETPPYSNDVLIGQAGLRENQTFLYLFDFGDEWLFHVTVTSIFDASSPLSHPALVKAKGTAPKQYSD